MLKNCEYSSNLHRSGFPQHAAPQLLCCCWTQNEDCGGSLNPVSDVDSVSSHPVGFLSLRYAGYVLWVKKPMAPGRSCLVLPEWRWAESPTSRVVLLLYLCGSGITTWRFLKGGPSKSLRSCISPLFRVFSSCCILLNVPIPPSFRLCWTAAPCLAPLENV